MVELLRADAVPAVKDATLPHRAAPECRKVARYTGEGAAADAANELRLSPDQRSNVEGIRDLAGGLAG